MTCPSHLQSEELRPLDSQSTALFKKMGRTERGGAQAKRKKKNEKMEEKRNRLAERRKQEAMSL